MNDLGTVGIGPETRPVDLSRPHLAGIGDPELTALAAFYVSAELPVTGSEAAPSPMTAELHRRGCTIWTGSSPARVHGASAVIASPALPYDDSEVAAAHQQGIPVISPARALTALTSARVTIAVTGTCGKTWTGGLLAHLLKQAGADPSWIIGDDLVGMGPLSRAHRGEGDLMVIECDPATAMTLRPDITVLTNLHEERHIGTAAGLLEQMTGDSLVIAHGDDPGVRELLERAEVSCTPARLVTYGRDGDSAWTIAHAPHGSGYRIRAHGPRSAIVEAGVPGPGLHQAHNAVAAVLTAISLGPAPRDIIPALTTFAGVRRRLTIAGVVQGVTVLDSVARHPEAIRADLAAARDLTEAHGEVHLLHVPASSTDLTAQTRHLLRTGADHIILLPPLPEPAATDSGGPAHPHRTDDWVGIRQATGPDEALEMASAHARRGDVIVVMGSTPRADRLTAPLLQRLCNQIR